VEVQRIPGQSNLCNKNGVLNVPRYLRVPYCLLNSESFLLLSPLAVKIYFMILRQWKTNESDKPVEISIAKMRTYCPSPTKPDSLIGRNQIADAIKQLMKYGFIHKVNQYKKCNKYYIEQRRFTGEYR